MSRRRVEAWNRKIGHEKEKTAEGEQESRTGALC